MISIIMPTYSRGSLLNKSVERLMVYMKEEGYKYELILVFDGGTSQTKDAVINLAQNNEEVKGLLLQNNVGQQQATLFGMQHCQYPVILTMDDDLENDISAIPQMLERLHKGYDLVYGVCNRPYRSSYRQLGTLLKEKLCQWWLKKPSNLQLSSYKMMTEDLVNQVKDIRKKHVYISAELLKLEIKIDQVIVKAHPSVDPKSGYTWTKMMKVLWQLTLAYGPLSSLNKNRPLKHEMMEVV